MPPPSDAVASPTPSNMPPPPNLKRPRPSATNPTPLAAGAPVPARAKRRKADLDDGDNASEGGKGRAGASAAGGSGAGGGPVNFSVGMVKGREDEFGEPTDVVTKIDFNKLPVETLYKYLEFHDLLPRWETSPWSEEPCTPRKSVSTATALYSSQPPPPQIPLVPLAPQEKASSPTPSIRPENPVVPPVQESSDPTPSDIQNAEKESSPPPPVDGAAAPTDAAASAASKENANDGQPEGSTEQGEAPPEGEKMDQDANEDIPEDTVQAPTTRSKTLPSRKPATPPPPTPPPQQPEVKRGVITLADVHAARAVLAEKANAHWMKGLGGGQNKEGETIVNFLYKMKVGPGRLLRVYNPWPPTYPC